LRKVENKKNLVLFGFDVVEEGGVFLDGFVAYFWWCHCTSFPQLTLQAILVV
jgi:hypothetical protein